MDSSDRFICIDRSRKGRLVVVSSRTGRCAGAFGSAADGLSFSCHIAMLPLLSDTSEQRTPTYGHREHVMLKPVQGAAFLIWSSMSFIGRNNLEISWRRPFDRAAAAQRHRLLERLTRTSAFHNWPAPRVFPVCAELNTNSPVRLGAGTLGLSLVESQEDRGRSAGMYADS